MHRNEELADLCAFIMREGGADLRNARPPSRGCRLCRGVPSTKGYDLCYSCERYASRLSCADSLGFVFYASAGSVFGDMMHRYKEAAHGDFYDLFKALVPYALTRHRRCIEQFGRTRPDAWAVVPSLRRGRPSPHPLVHLAAPFLAHLPRIDLRASDDVNEDRSFRPANFTVYGELGNHVLLLDDTWVGGGHLQSAAAAVKQAGAEEVTGLVFARWLEPDRSYTREFMADLTEEFDPDICPFHGVVCAPD